MRAQNPERGETQGRIASPAWGCGSSTGAKPGSRTAHPRSPLEAEHCKHASAADQPEKAPVKDSAEQRHAGPVGAETHRPPGDGSKPAKGALNPMGAAGCPKKRSVSAGIRPGRVVRDLRGAERRDERSNSATHAPRRTQNRLMQSGVEGQPLPRAITAFADRTDDDHNASAAAPCGTALPIKKMSRGVTWCFLSRHTPDCTGRLQERKTAGTRSAGARWRERGGRIERRSGIGRERHLPSQHDATGKR